MPRIVVLADTITPFALSALKYGLFALLFLFIWRSMRWVVRGLSVAEASAAAERGGRRPPQHRAHASPGALDTSRARAFGREAEDGEAVREHDRRTRARMRAPP